MLKKKLSKGAALLFLFFSSCTDQGCIDAGDFGEYQAQTLTVLANATESSCNYDATLTLIDANQGSGLKTCFTSGSATVTDENSITQITTSGGCNGKQSDGTPLDINHLNLCINNCVRSCLNGSTAIGGVASSEPNWIATDSRDGSKNLGVQILPGSKITVNATGLITLSNSANYKTIYIPVDNISGSGMQENYNSSSWVNDSIFDVKSGQTFNINFSGLWTRAGSAATTADNYYINSKIGGGSNALGSSDNNTSSIYNGARTLVAYTINQPAGYSFDYTKSSDVLGTIGVPLLPDPRAWTCDYNPANIYNTALTSAANFANASESNCHNIAGGYQNLGYAASVDVAVANNSNFQISSLSKAPGLGIYGGAIRWSGDGLSDANNDLVNNGINANITNSFSSSTNVAVPIVTSAAITSSGYSVSNNDPTFSYMVFIKSNVAASCDVSLSIYKDTTLVKGPVTASLTNSFSTYPTTARLSLSPGQRIIVSASSGSTCDSSTNINNKLSIKFQKFQDIQINQSGFVRFSSLNTSSGSCVLNGRIINPINSDSSYKENNASDFYEYDSFTDSPSKDPLNNLAVPNSASTIINWSNKFFVRKGQTIRLSPVSWNGTITSGTNVRQCGVGMVMQINPRPALLCKGIAAEQVANTNSNCLQDFDSNSGNLIGCQAFAQECSNSSDTSNYCPYQTCQSTITCTSGVAPSYAKTSCSAVSNINSSACNNSLISLSTADQTTYKNRCASCSSKMLANASLPAKITQTLDQCYDLESYTGRVSDIPTTTTTPLDQDDPSFSKGAKKLTTFNGYYGNLDNFIDSGSVDSSANNNKIYQSKSPIVFSQNSRLKFLFLTNDNDFSKLGTNYSTSKSGLTSYLYTSSSSRGSSYNGSNGFKIDFSGTLQFSNGQWLEAKLCRVSDDGSDKCSGINIASQTSAIDAQPHLVEINNPVSGVTDPVLSSVSNYKFDAFGTLTRTTAPGAKDCTVGSQAIDTQINSAFYCHTYLNSSSLYIYDSTKKAPFTDSDYNELNKLRLTFKIKDSETPNCLIKGTTGANNGIKSQNPAYQSSQSGNTGAMCGNADGDPSLSSPSPCTKEFYCANLYSNNSGNYQVTVKVENPPGNSISNIIGGVITPVIEVMDGKTTLNSDGSTTTTVGQSERIYNLVVQDVRYQAILSMCLVLMLVFYGLTYLMGIASLSSTDLINRCIKIAVVYFFASPDGWYWFNLIVVKWFKNGTDYLAFMMASSFDNSPSLDQAISTGNYYDKSVLFSSVDKVFGLFFSQVVQKKISALLFASIFGWVYLIIIYFSFLYYVYAVGYAVLYYLTAQIFISILFTLGPIFFIFTLFNQTKGMFDSWLNQLIGFSLQQIFLLTTLAFFNMMMYEVLKMSLGYKICWEEVWTINIITRISLLSFWTVASIPPRVNIQSDLGNIGHPEGIPSLFSILFIWVIASLMQTFIIFMTDLAASIGGSIKASAMAEGALKTIQEASKYSTDRFNDFTKATIGEPIKRLDHALFDSGEHAETARKERREKNRTDSLKKDSLMKAGNEAVSEYKRNNASEYAKMTDDQKKAKLQEIREKGIKKKADKMGIKEDELKTLKEDKGLKYEGSNVLVAGMQAARQGMGYGGGTLNKSMNEAKVDTNFKYGEATDAMKKMSAEERKSFKEAADKGQVQIGKSNSQKIVDAAKVGTFATASITSGGIIPGAYLASSKEARTSLANAANKLAGKTSNAFGFNEYAKATKDLEEKGIIPKMAYGTNWARPDSEKKLINEQLQKNRQENTANVAKTNNAVTLAKLGSLDKGLTKDENTKRPIATAVSSSIFGAGGIERAFMAQGEKFGGNLASVKANNTQNVAIGFANELSKTQSQRDQIISKQDSAKKAATDITQVQALEKIQRDSNGTIDNSKEIAAIKAGSQYYKDQESLTKLAEQQKTEKDPKELAKISGAMNDITSKPNYVANLNNANSIYQGSKQELENVDKKLASISSSSAAVEKASQSYQSVPSSDATKKLQEDYNKIGAWEKLRGGFSDENKETISDYKKLQSFTKDYGNLSDLKQENFNSDSKGKSFAGESYDNFNKKYEDFVNKYKK
ncbi:MAG: type IV secretion system protein [Rickettsiales bacterium]|nr:type IV secretion system protein [Rickettsiales bacterium]